jgi:hypothetical protein
VFLGSSGLVPVDRRIGQDLRASLWPSVANRAMAGPALVTPDRASPAPAVEVLHPRRTDAIGSTTDNRGGA